MTGFIWFRRRTKYQAGNFLTSRETVSYSKRSLFDSQFACFRPALLEVTAQRTVIIPYGRFGTTYRSQPQGSGIYHYSLRNNPEEHSSQLLRGGGLKSRCLFVCLLKWYA